MPLIVLETVFVLFWASGFVSAEIALADAGPFTTLSIRLLFAAGLLLPVVLRAWVRMDRRQIGAALGEGASTQALWLTCVYLAQDLGARPGDVALIASLQPMLTTILAGLWLDERTSRWQWLGLGLGMAGTWLVVMPDGEGAGFGLGHLVAAGTVIVMTGSVLYRRKRVAAAALAGPRLASLGLQFVAAAAVVTPLALTLEGWSVAWTGRYAANMVWQVLVLSLGSYGLLWLLIDRTSAVRASSLFYFTPAGTVVMAHLVLGDPIGLADVAGLTVALAGVTLIRLDRPRATPRDGRCPAPTGAG